MALHPSGAMLTDLERRMAGLAEQRPRLLEQQQLPLPPEGIAREVPGFEPLPASTSTTAPAPPPPLVDEPLADARRYLADDVAREFARRQRVVQQRYETVLRERSLTLQRRAAEERERVYRRYRFPIYNSELRLEYAHQQTLRANADVESLRLRLRLAEQELKALEQYAQDRPRDARAARRAAEARARMEEMQTRLAQLEQQAREAKAREDDLDLQLKEEQHSLRIDLSRVDQELAAAMLQARRGSDLLREEELTRVREELETGAARDLAALRERLTAQQETVPDTAPPPTVDFPAVEAETRALDTIPMRHAMHQNQFTGLQQRLEAARAIDEVVHKLTIEWIELRRIIRLDVEDAARSAAAQHNYTLALDTPRGADVTARVREWLADYWPQDAPAASTD